MTKADDELTLNGLIEWLTRLRDEHGHGDLPMRLEDDRGVPSGIRDIWLYWDDDAEVREPARRAP